jgi:hypothetical protein
LTENTRVLQQSYIAAILLIFLSASAPAQAGGINSDDPKVEIFGEIGNRVEHDDVDGQGALNRTRFRVLGQLGLNYHPTSTLTFQGAFRTGNENSAHSSAATYYQVDGGDYGEPIFWPEIYQFIWADDGARVRLGRMAFPFFQPTPPFWDADSTILGGFGELTTRQRKRAALPAVGASKAMVPEPDGEILHKLRAGGFMLPDGIWRLNGQMAAAQYEMEVGLPHDSAWRAALGFYQIFGEEGAAYQNDLVDGLDYSLLNLSTRYSSRLPGGGIPWALSADAYYNLNDPGLSSAERGQTHYKNEQWGFAVRAQIGRNEQAGDLSFGYTYAYVGKFAINEMHSFDAFSARLRSDYQGHELRVKYTIVPNLNVQARAAFFDSLSRSTESTRLRLDMVWSF